MSVRRDSRTDRWYFRTRVTFPDGRRERIYGTPGVSGPYHDLSNTKAGASEAERRAIAKAMTGVVLRPVPKAEVPSIRTYATDTFMTLQAASDKPSSRVDKQHRLDAYILPAVGDRRLDELRQEHVDALTHAMLEDGLARKTINNTLAVLSSLVKYAVKNHVITDPKLVFTIAAQDAALASVAPGDVDLLAAAANPRYRVALLLAADAGLRIGEVRALQWLEVNELARELTIAWSYDRAGNLTETKGWKRRTVPINDRLWDALREVPRVGPLVFSRLDGRPIGYDAVRDVAHEIYKAAKVTPPAMPWHALRHTFGTELANRGTEIQTIRELMGHESIETTLRYLHTNRDAKRAAVGALGSPRAAGSKTKAK